MVLKWNDACRDSQSLEIGWFLFKREKGSPCFDPGGSSPAFPVSFLPHAREASWDLQSG